LENQKIFRKLLGILVGKLLWVRKSLLFIIMLLGILFLLIVDGM
jgi:hypothetical protein